MADNFTGNQVQAVMGKWVPVLDASITFSQNNVQAVMGKWVPVLDETAGVSAITPSEIHAAMQQPPHQPPMVPATAVPI